MVPLPQTLTEEDLAVNYQLTRRMDSLWVRGHLSMRGDQECRVWNKESVPDAGAGNPPGMQWEKSETTLGFSGVRKTWCQKDTSNLEKSQFYVEESGLTTPTWWRNENYQYLVKVTALQFWGLASQPRECWNAPATRRDRTRLSKGWLTQVYLTFLKSCI